jgi:hypothetical protein
MHMHTVTQQQHHRPVCGGCTMPSLRWHHHQLRPEFVRPGSRPCLHHPVVTAAADTFLLVAVGLF